MWHAYLVTWPVHGTSAEALGMGSDPESEDVAPMPALQKGRAWCDSWRRGCEALLEPLRLPYLFCVAVSMLSQDY